MLKIEIPYIVHEGEMARLERTIRRLWVLCLIMFLAFVLTNGLWFYYDSQFDDVTVTQEAQAEDGGKAIVNNGGDLSYGESEADY